MRVMMIAFIVMIIIVLFVIIIRLVQVVTECKLFAEILLFVSLCLRDEFMVVFHLIDWKFMRLACVFLRVHRFCEEGMFESL